MPRWSTPYLQQPDPAGLNRTFHPRRRMRLPKSSSTTSPAVRVRQDARHDGSLRNHPMNHRVTRTPPAISAGTPKQRMTCGCRFHHLSGRRMRRRSAEAHGGAAASGHRQCRPGALRANAGGDPGRRDYDTARSINDRLMPRNPGDLPWEPGVFGAKITALSPAGPLPRGSARAPGRLCPRGVQAGGQGRDDPCRAAELSGAGPVQAYES